MQAVNYIENFANFSDKLTRLVRARTLAPSGIHVQGRDVCSYCRNDIATAVRKAELKSVTVHAIDEKNRLHIYTWSSGEKSLKEVKNGK